MKNKIYLLAIMAMLTCVFIGCNNEKEKNYPFLYVVNGTSYSADVYCDNHLVATAGAHNNSGKMELFDVSINLPVYVEVYLYDSKKNYVASYNWDHYYFRWNKTYKMTINSSKATLMEVN